MPKRVTIDVGTTVISANEDDNAHTVTKFGEAFDSDSLSRGAVHTHTFAESDRHDFGRDYHLPEGGGVTVRPLPLPHASPLPLGHRRFQRHRRSLRQRGSCYKWQTLGSSDLGLLRSPSSPASCRSDRLDRHLSTARLGRRAEARRRGVDRQRMVEVDGVKQTDRGGMAPAPVLLVLATLFWAGNFVVGRPLTEALPPFGITLVRWVLASLILVPLTILREGRFARPARSLWPALAGMAVTGVLLFNTLVYAALGYTTSVNASLINATTPILTLLLVAGLARTRPQSRASLGALLGLVGVAWIVAHGEPLTLLARGPNRGDLLMLLAAALWAIYTILAQRVTRRISPLLATTTSTLLALPLLAGFGGLQLATEPPGPITPVAVAGLLYVGGFASVAAFLAWNAGIARMGADRGAIFLNLIPVFTALIAVPVLGDGLGPAQIVGGILVVGGVTLTSWRGTRPSKSSTRLGSSPSR